MKITFLPPSTVLYTHFRFTLIPQLEFFLYWSDVFWKWYHLDIDLISWTFELNYFTLSWARNQKRLSEIYYWFLCINVYKIERKFKLIWLIIGPISLKSSHFPTFSVIYFDFASIYHTFVDISIWRPIIFGLVNFGMQYN